MKDRPKTTNTKITSAIYKQERDNHLNEYAKRIQAERQIELSESKLQLVNFRLLSYLNRLAATGNNTAISLFFDSFQNLEFIDSKPLNAYTALMHAAEGGHLSTCELLMTRFGKERINAGACFDSDHTSQIDSNALDMAATHGHLEICRLLVEHGAQVNDSSYCYGTLSRAVLNNHPSIVRYLLEPNVRKAIGLTQNHLDEALNEAENCELLSILIDAGAHIDACSNANPCALDMAIYRADKESMRYLLGRGANLEVVDFRELLDIQAYKGLTVLLEMVNAEQKSRIIELCESRYHELEQDVADEILDVEDPQSKACFATFFSKKNPAIDSQRIDIATNKNNFERKL